MKKNILALAGLLLTTTAPAFAETAVEFRAAAFFPMSQRFRDIYGTVGADYELQVTSSSPCRCFDIWANLTWYPKSGDVGRRCGSSNITLANISFGPQWDWCFCSCFNFYAGIGPILGGVFVENKMRCCSGGCLRKDDSEWAFAVGGIIKTGVTYTLCECLFFDLFVDYFYEPAFFRHHMRDIGGFRTGLGVGLQF